MANVFEIRGNYRTPEDLIVDPKDNGKKLLVDINTGLRKFSRVIGKEDTKQLNGMIQNISRFKDTSPNKYKEFFDKTESMPWIWGDSEVEHLEKFTDRKYAEKLCKIFFINNLVELDKINPPKQLQEIMEEHLKEKKIPGKRAIEWIMKNIVTKEDLNVIERGLKIYEWNDVSSIIVSRDQRYKAVANEKKFLKIEKSIRKIEEGYERKLKFNNAKAKLHLLSYPKYAEKILSLKEQIKELEGNFKIKKVEHIDEFEKINNIKVTGELRDILSGKFKAKMDLIKEVYDLERFESVDILQNWSNLPEDIFEVISSNSFTKKIEGLGEQIGRSKGEIIKFFAGENFTHIDHPRIKALLEGNIVLSNDVKEGKPDIVEILGTFPEGSGATLWGRVGKSVPCNVIRLITFGRPVLGRDPYLGWEYIAAARNITKDDLNKQDNKDNLLALAEGSEKEPGLDKAKEKFNFVKENLPPSLKTRFNKIFETFEKWREEGEKIEEKNSGISLTVGAYVKTDSDPEVLKASQESSIQNKSYYGEIYTSLDKSFQAPSWVSLRIGKGIEMIYDSVKKSGSDINTELVNLIYLANIRKNISPIEKKLFEEKNANILNVLNAFGLMESVVNNTPKGVYLSGPPIHGGARGEDPLQWTPRTYALRDRVFQKIEENKKETYVNTKEYYLSKPGDRLDQLKIRLYSFSDKPDPKNLADEGFSVEIDRNGETKFLSKAEVEDFTKALKERTLLTLFLEKSPLLEVGGNIGGGKPLNDLI